MNIEIFFPLTDDEPDLVLAQQRHRLLAVNWAADWGKALLTAFAIHLLVVFFALALMPSRSEAPFKPEHVVVVQLAEFAAPEASPPLPAKIIPQAAAKPTPVIENKPKSRRPKSALETAKAENKKISPEKPTKTALTAIPEPVAPAVVAESAEQTALPPLTQKNVGVTASTASTTTAATVILEPRPIRRPKPAYPPQAQRRGLEGKVILQVTVGVDGAVRAVAVNRGSSHLLLDEAAVASVWDWRFQPGEVGGSRQEMTILLPVDFRLR
jgi:protein TonB